MAHLQGVNTIEKRDRVLEIARHEGLKAGIMSGVVASAGVAALQKFSPWFRKSASVSAKTALVVSPLFLATVLRMELVMHYANLDPEKYGIVGDGHVDARGKHKPLRQLSLPQKAANWCYKNPFKVIAGMGVPAVGGILYSMRNEGNLKFSQKIMHTRVYGQITVVSMLVATMTFQEIMKRNGGLFVIEASEEEEEEEEGGAVA